MTSSAADISSAVASGFVVYNVQLRPENEVRPAVTTDPVESVAKAHVQLKLYDDNTLEYKIQINNPANETFVAGHIHRAPEGTNGPVVVTLLNTPSSDSHIDFRSTTVVSPVVADMIRANPENFHVNLHTTKDPQGAVRGQLP